MREFLRRLFGNGSAQAPPRSRPAANVASRSQRSVLQPEQRPVIYRAEYMSADLEHQALSDGLEDARLRRVRDRLVIETPLGWLNPRSRGAHRHGLYCFKVAGTSHHEAALKAGDFSPGAPVRLEREPQNAHDPNAIAVYAAAGRKVGFVPASHAKRLAPVLDGGAELVALSMRGGRPREIGVVPDVLVCDRRTMERLRR